MRPQRVRPTGWGCSSLGQNHPGSGAQPKLGLCLQDSVHINIYIYVQPDGGLLVSRAESPAGVQAAGVQAGAGSVREPGRPWAAAGRGCCSAAAGAVPDAKPSLRVFGVKALSPSRELGLGWAGKSIRATP